MIQNRYSGWCVWVAYCLLPIKIPQKFADMVPHSDLIVVTQLR